MAEADDLTARLEAIYQQAAEDIRATIARRGIATGREEFLLRQIDTILMGLAGESDGVVDALTIAAYVEASTAAADANQRDVVDFDRTFGRIDTLAVNALALRAKDDLRKGLGLARGRIQGLVRSTQLSPVTDDSVRTRVAAAIAEGASPDVLARRLRPIVAEGLLGAEVADQLRDVLADVRITVGGGTFKLSQYATIVSDTMRREAETQAIRNRMTANGLDLVQVTSRRGVADSCRVFEDLIVSISGQSEGFVSLSSLPNGGPPFHPRCTHVLASRSALFLDEDEIKRESKISKRFLGRSFRDLERMRRKQFGGNADAMRRAARS